MHSSHRSESHAVPPWERRDVEQVPYRAPHRSPQLGDYDSFDDPFGQRRSRSRSAHRRPSPNPRGLSYESHRAPIPFEGYRDPRPRQDSTTRTWREHYEGDFVGLPTTKEDTRSFGPDALPTPPLSAANSSSGSPPLDLPRRRLPPRPVAMNGTMSARDRRTPRPHGSFDPRAQSTHSRKNSVKSDKSDAPKLSQKIKSTFRDIFKREPIDETEFERIGNRHWADED